MGIKRTKYCQNIGPRHLRGESPNKQYCLECYTKLKERYARIESEGGPIAGLRGARVLADGSFGYERTAQEKERNLNAFFYYVMPHIPEEKAKKYIKDIVSQGNSNDFCTNDGIRRVKMFK